MIMREKILIFSVAGLIIFFLGFVAHIQYFQTKDNLIELYSEKQTTLALQAATGLESYIKERIKALELLANMSYSFNENQQRYETEFKRIYHVVTGFQHIFFVDTSGMALFGYPGGFPCPANQPGEIRRRFEKVFVQAARLKKTLVFERNVLIDGKVTVCFITPVFSQDNDFLGAIIGSLGVRKALFEALKPIMVGHENHAWVINEPGYLIYHPHHEEILIQNLFSPRRDCFQCHQNFDLEKTMIAQASGVAIKDNLKIKKQLIAYARVPLANTKWVVAISTPFETITTSLRSEFRNFLLMIVFIIVTIIFGAFLVNRISTKHLMARKELESLKIQTALIRKKNEAESRYRILVEQSPDPIFLSTETKLIMVNQSFENLFGYRQSEVSGADFSFLKLVADGDKAKFRREIELIITGRKQTAIIALKMINKAGDSLEVEVSLSRFPLEDRTGYQGVIHDVTRVKQLEREREQRKHLALLGEMAARIAHEIKNPLASIQTGIQLLESKIADDNELKSYYQRLRREIQRVDAILKGLLFYARDEKLNTRLTPIEPLILRFQELVRPMIQKHRLKLEVKLEKDLPPVLIDEHKMEQVLWNICLNSIQASKPSGRIILSALHHNNGVDIKVTDEGSGIPENMMNKIFQPFFSTRTQGSGLGLAISKKIVQLHGGQMMIESKLNQGTTVTIHLHKISQ